MSESCSKTPKPVQYYVFLFLLNVFMLLFFYLIGFAIALFIYDFYFPTGVQLDIDAGLSRVEYKNCLQK